MSFSRIAGLTVFVASLFLLWDAAVEGQKVPREKCMINAIDKCNRFPQYSGLHDDSDIAYNTLGVGQNEANCLARAKQYFEWCENKVHQQVIAVFVPSGAETAYPTDEDVEKALSGEITWPPGSHKESQPNAQSETRQATQAHAETPLAKQAQPTTSDDKEKGGSAVQASMEALLAVSQTVWEKMKEAQQYVAERVAPVLWAQTLALFAFTKRHTHALVLLIDERVSAYMQPDAATPTQKAGAAGWPPIASVLVGVLVVVITSLGPRLLRAVFSMLQLIGLLGRGGKKIDWVSLERERVLRDPQDFRKVERIAIGFWHVIATRPMGEGEKKGEKKKKGWLQACFGRKHTPTERETEEEERYAVPVARSAEAVRAVVKRFGPLNVFVVTAGQGGDGGAEEARVVRWLKESGYAEKAGLVLNRGHVIVVDRRSKAIEQQQMQEVVKKVGVTTMVHSDRGVAETVARAGDCGVYLMGEEEESGKVRNGQPGKKAEEKGKKGKDGKEADDNGHRAGGDGDGEKIVRVKTWEEIVTADRKSVV